MTSTIHLDPAKTAARIDFDPNINGTPCAICNKDTHNTIRKKVGLVTFGWCLCLLLCSGVLWIYPCCTDSCKDTQFVCKECKCVKMVSAANCC